MAYNEQVVEVLGESNVKVLEANDISATISSNGETYYVEMEFYSPNGEDFVMSVDCTGKDDFGDAFRQYAEDFDANEHTRMWAESSDMDIGVLYEDAEKIKAFLLEVADELEGKVPQQSKDANSREADTRLDSLHDLADEIEQFMYERGEYDFSPDERPIWLQIENAEDYQSFKSEDAVSVSRDEATENIYLSLSEEKIGGTSRLLRYLREESNVMDEADELMDTVGQLIDRVQDSIIIPEPAYTREEVTEWGKQAFLDCNYGDTSIQLSPVNYDDYIRTATIRDTFREYCEDNDGYANFSDYLTDKMNVETFSEVASELEYELVEKIRSKASEKGADFLAAFDTYADDLPSSEILEEFGYEGYEFDLADYLSNDYRMNLLFATESEQNFDMTGLLGCYTEIDRTVAMDDNVFQQYADNALSYLIHQQGYTVEDAMNALSGEETTSKFMKSVVAEVEEISSYHLGELAVCVSASGQELLDLLDSISKDEGYMEFSERTTIGIHNSYDGTTSQLDIQCEQPAVLPTSMVHTVQFESSGRDDFVSRDSNGWTIDDVCGLIGSVWTDGSVKLTDEAPTLMQENLLDTKAAIAKKLEEPEKNKTTVEYTDD